TSFELPPEILALGLVTGLTYGLTAVALVMVYRVTRIINFAHGVLGSLPALLLPIIVIKANVPWGAAVPMALAAGAAGGALLEWAVIRRLREAPRLVTMVATI